MTSVHRMGIEDLVSLQSNHDKNDRDEDEFGFNEDESTEHTQQCF